MERWLMKRALTETHLHKRFVQVSDSTAPPPRIQLNDQAVAEYMKGVREYKESEFVLAHTTRGGPSRRSEVTTIYSV
jgi:hypothetical protein